MSDSTSLALLQATIKIIATLRDRFQFLSGAEKRRREVRRFKRLYVPLRNLFLTRHVAVARAVGAPYFRHRLRNAIDVFYDINKPSAAVKKACRALFDKQIIGPSAEIEFSGYFPHDEIVSIAQENAEFADKKLLDLIARADRAGFEEMTDGGQMTQADFELHEHIYKEHARLSSKYA